jgi:hypothetical protein
VGEVIVDTLDSLAHGASQPLRSALPKNSRHGVVRGYETKIKEEELQKD